VNQRPVTEQSKWLSRYPKKKLFFLTVIVLSVALAATFFIDEGEKEWESEIVQENVSERFVQIEVDDKVEIFYLESREGVVKSASRPKGLLSRLNPVSWGVETVDDEEGSGSFLSSEQIRDETFIAHQDGNVGEAAVYFTEKQEEWETETVDTIEEQGPNVGLYTSLTYRENEPLIFYHAAQGDRFLKAERAEGEWTTEELESDIGWFTDTDSCGEEAFVAVRGRGEDNIYLGRYDGEWRLEDLGVETDTDVAIAQKDCEPAIAYLDTDNWKLTFKQDGEKETFSESRFSRIDLEIEDSYHLLYSVRDEGLFHAESSDGEDWSKQLVSDSENAGEYNDLALDNNGYPHVAYLEEGDLHYASKKPENLKKVAFLQIMILASILIVFIIFYRAELRELVRRFSNSST